MPQRYIKIPDDIKIVLRTGEETDTSVSFGDILDKLLSSPKWVANYSRIRSANAIWSSYENVLNGVMVLAEDDWKVLKDSAENPEVTLFSATTRNNEVVPGLGFHPSVTPQLLPHLRAIVEASSEHPGN